MLSDSEDEGADESLDNEGVIESAAFSPGVMYDCRKDAIDSGSGTAIDSGRRRI